MYWPTSAARILAVPQPLGQDELITVKQSRRGNYFASLSETTIGIWDVRPTVLQTAVVRSKESMERWGANKDVIWTHDSRGVLILTTTSHLLIYQLVPTGQPAYESAPTSSFPSSGAGEGDLLAGYELKPTGVAFVMGRCQSVLAQQHNLLLSLQHPPAILNVPFPIPQQLLAAPGSHFPPLPLDGDTEEQVECDIWDLTEAKAWIRQEERVPVPLSITATRVHGLPTTYTILMDDGQVYAMHHVLQLEMVRAERGGFRGGGTDRVVRHDPDKDKFIGQAVYPLPPPRRSIDEGMKSLGLGAPTPPAVVEDKALHVSVNGRLGWVSIGTASGLVYNVILPPHPRRARLSHAFDLKHSANLRFSPGAVTSLEWTSDGYALAVGYERGWAVWSMGGRLGGWGAEALADEEAWPDSFMNGAKALFWAPGNLDLFLLTPTQDIYALPFVKSATTGQHSPDNTRYAFLQMDDRVLVYRGADQPDMSVINPESDVWQHVHIPTVYIATNWPIRYASISNDGRFIAVAGRRGLTHYSAASGRWKLFAHEREERAFTVRGGLLWFHHVLIAAVERDKKYQIRLYSRDQDLSEANVLHAQNLPSQVLVTTLLDNSLLVYTADSMLYHFLILPTQTSIRLQLCGSIGFSGLISVPSRVRALSWMIPEAQKRLGDPADDLIVATIIFLVDGRFILLRPRKAGNDEVRYDKQVLADRIESYWTHLHGVGTLENSLWGYDGERMRVWLDALTIEGATVDPDKDTYETVQESIALRLDFYPLSILMDKGIIIGVDYEISTRSLPFVLFKTQTSTHLFLPKFLRYHLDAGRVDAAMALAANYKNLVYFGHSLEVLLHSVLEDAVDARRAAGEAGGSSAHPTLALVTSFLDHFPQSLDVVVGCARKTELEHWGILFEQVGRPRDLFEKCIRQNLLRTAASYLLVMHTQEEDDDVADTIRLLRLAIGARETQLCKELLRFLRSIDESGAALKAAVDEVGIFAQASPID
ncbi:WD40 repeat protein [Vanrija albida]|uniref:WD40 repeat protein n=1 Tax=Vanrija albida TaxID=181172 RepID=A0ABR3Q062_9TREE